MHKSGLTFGGKQASHCEGGEARMHIDELRRILGLIADLEASLRAAVKMDFQDMYNMMKHDNVLIFLRDSAP